MTNQQTQPTKSISARIPLHLFQQLHCHAKQADLTMSQVLRKLLKSYEPVANAPVPAETPSPPPSRPTSWLVGSR
jgi:hypothetical protein